MHGLFFLGHPAHFHLFRGTIEELKRQGHKITIFIKKKDILESLLQRAGLEYINALPDGRKDGKVAIAWSVVKKNIKLLRFCLKNRPDWMAGTSAEIAHIGFLLRIPSFVFSEDDYDIISTFAKVTYPFASHVVSPFGCRNGRWDSKTIRYAGYHKLAYLHPNRFKPDASVVDQYFPHEKPYFIIRLAKLNAHHDEGASGISNKMLHAIIDLLKEKGRVFITSERSIPEEFNDYLLKINPLDIHHLMSFSSLYIGDSQSMAVEASMLGVPNIRISSFSGKISVLEELEHQYKLTVGVHPKEEEKILSTLQSMVKNAHIKEEFLEKRNRMLEDKIDVTAWLIELFSHPPKTKSIS
jgi:predicted glycosyltransferase